MIFSVCTDMIFPGMPTEQAIYAVRDAGFSAYEFWEWENKNIDALRAAQDETGLRLATMCTVFASPVDPREHDRFVDGLRSSITVAKRLGCENLITQPGSALPGVSREEQFASMKSLFRRCAPILEDSGVTLLLEPLNVLVDHRGCFLSVSREAFDVVREIASPRIKVLFDVYHQQITEGNLIRNLTENIEWVGHIHVAGNPGRHDPSIADEINYHAVFEALDRAGYVGFAGLEYAPLGNAAESLRRFYGEFS